MKKFNIPEDVLSLCKLLKDNNHDAYLVGGCIRDLLLDKEPKDYDIATNALPNEIIKLFDNFGAYILNIKGASKHGVVFIKYHDKEYEISTYRKDINYIDNRHCEIVVGVGLSEDLSRRDFTINALAYDPFKDIIIDEHNGLNDLDNKIIKTVGNSIDRFNEDGLRILRAFRLSSQISFMLDDALLIAAESLKGNLDNISMERKAAELSKILIYDPKILIKMNEINILDKLLPELSKAILTKDGSSDIGNYSINICKNIEEDVLLKWTALLCKLDKNNSSLTAENILRRYNFSNNFINQSISIIDNIDLNLLNKKSIRRYIGKYGKDNLDKHFKLKKAIILSQDRKHLNERIDLLNKEIEIYYEIKNKEPYNNYKINDLKINGDDIKSLGVKEGKEVGELLNYVYELTLEDPKINSKDNLIKLVKEKKKNK